MSIAELVSVVMMLAALVAHRVLRLSARKRGRLNARAYLVTRPLTTKLKLPCLLIVTCERRYGASEGA
jgi:hypothetical protein